MLQGCYETYVALTACSMEHAMQQASPTPEFTMRWECILDVHCGTTVLFDSVLSNV